MNRFEQRSKRSYDKKAKNYDDTFDGKFTRKFKQILLETIIVKNGDTLLDVACGNGAFLKMLDEQKSFKGYGVDISDEMIKEAKKRNPSMDFYVGACETLPFENESVQIMTVCAAFHHFPDVKAFAKEAHRVLMKDGVLYIAELYMPAVLRVICNPFFKFSPAGDVKCYSDKEIADLFKMNNFKVDKIMINGMTQLVILRK